ncbi:MAG: hypothetical protein ACYCW6_03650 [Candidatus Xenobia bacterium]
MQIAGNPLANSNLLMWTTPHTSSDSAQSSRDPMAPQDRVDLSTLADTPENGPQFAISDTPPDMIAGSPQPFNPSVQKELKHEDGFLTRQRAQGRHFVKLNQDGSRIGFAARNVNGDNILYTGQPAGSGGMMVDGYLRYDKSDDGHVTRTTYQASQPFLMQFSQDSEGSLLATAPPIGIFSAVKVDR